jgi:hypothetical protein
MQVTITAAPLPTNFKGTPQQLIEALLDRLEITFDGSSFVISDIQPVGNQGPWLKNGTQWWVWDDSTSTYIPLDLSASISDQIYIGDISNGPPDPTVYQLWLQLNGTAVNGLFYYAGSTAGWVTEASVLVPGAITPVMLHQQPPGSLITFNVNSQTTILPPGNPGTILLSSGNGLLWGSIVESKGIPNFIAPVTLATISTTTYGQWTTISTLLTNGVPLTASAIILGFFIVAGGLGVPVMLQVRPNSAGAVYNAAAKVNGASVGDTMWTQGIFPFASSSGVLSFDYTFEPNPETGLTTDDFTGSYIQLLGYIS